MGAPGVIIPLPAMSWFSVSAPAAAAAPLMRLLWKAEVNEERLLLVTDSSRRRRRCRRRQRRRRVRGEGEGERGQGREGSGEGGPVRIPR